MGEPSGFTFQKRKNGEIVISHHGQIATTLRDSKAERFLEDITGKDPQHVMARLTGNYKRGNERQ